MLRTRTLCAVAALVAGSALAWARPPEGVPIDPVMHQWYQSLKEPGTPWPCCSEADCRPADYRMGADGYEALLDDKWIAVPRQKVLIGYDNPVGRAVVCRSPIDGSILCFVPTNET